MSNKFTEFLAAQAKNKAEDEKVDWAARRDEWIKNARTFVDQVKAYLDSYAEIETEIIEVPLTEEKLGAYSVPKLLIRLPNELIELEPVGTILIGAFGRFDMKGLAGTVKWVLVPKSSDRPVIKISINDDTDAETALVAGKLVWKLATPPPNIRYLPFNKEILQEAIMEVSHG